MSTVRKALRTGFGDNPDVSQWIAVKTSSTSRKFSKQPHDVVKEVRLLSSLSHVNVRFFAATHEEALIIATASSSASLTTRTTRLHVRCISGCRSFLSPLTSSSTLPPSLPTPLLLSPSSPNPTPTPPSPFLSLPNQLPFKLSPPSHTCTTQRKTSLTGISNPETYS